MNLKNFFSKFKKEPEAEQKFFLAIEVSLQDVKSALWTVAEGKTEVVKIGSMEKWDGKEKEGLLAAVDNSISTACEKARSEPQGIIFGLPLSWIKEEQIEANKKEFLKFICQKLELKPLGFVASLEALVTFLKQNEGTPINAIFVQFLEEQLLISLVELGKIKSSEVVGRSDDLTADVREGLTRFKKAQNLPARIIIYNGDQNLEEEKQQIVAFDWQEKLPFLHFPRVESLEKNKTIRAVALAGGAEVAKSLGFEIQAKEEENLSEAKAISAADLGFVLSADITQINPLVETEAKKETAEPRTEKEPQVEASPKLTSPRPEPKSPNLLIKISSGLKRIIFKLKLILSGGKKKLKLILALLPILVLATGIWAFFWYIPKAKITLYLHPKTIEKEINLTADLSASSVDLEEKIIPAVTQSITVSGKKTQTATGEKLIGEKASGSVTIYNKTEVEKTFSPGNLLVGPDNLEFVLQEEVSIASKSSQPNEEGEQIIYGRAQAEVKAAQIGAESNLSSGTNLTFKNYGEAQFSAKAETGLAGGSSQQVKVVSNQDLQDLKISLTENLEKEALEKLATQWGDEKVILDQGLETEILSQKFSAEADDEADQVELNLEIKFTAFAWNKTDLKTMLLGLLQNEIGDFVLDAGKTQLETKEAKLTKNKIQIETLAKVYLLPKIDFGQLKNELKGCQIDQCQDKFKNLPNFTEAEIEINPHVAGLFKRLPRNKQNITIEIRQEE